MKVYDGANLLGSATANGAGAWSFTTAALSNGAHSLSATASDVAGNTSASSSALSVTIDTVASVVDQVTAGPAAGTEVPGETIVVTVTLDEVVIVTGTPTLALNSGGTAIYSGGSGTDTLTFNYIVGANDTTVSALTITAVNCRAGPRSMMRPAMLLICRVRWLPSRSCKSTRLARRSSTASPRYKCGRRWGHECEHADAYGNGNSQQHCDRLQRRNITRHYSC